MDPGQSVVEKKDVPAHERDDDPGTCYPDKPDLVNRSVHLFDEMKP